ncbi:MAG: hypothetical protein K8W52_01290, partial [Deltaproteobacteria bacterium]|nr:hypothetical protein [Deltaproteobacteria bacterium]
PTATPIEPAPVAAPHVAATHTRASRTETPKAPKAAKPAPKPTRTATATAAPAAGKGTLGIGAKPPCDIIVDGKSTGLTTPQRSLALAAGPHTITLVNRANGIKKTFSVSIQAGASTKVVKDYSALIKH